MANLAAFSRPEADRVDEMADVDAENSFELLDTVDAPAVLETILRALEGRLNTDGEARPADGKSSLAASASVAGCWRTANTNVLFTPNREFWGCMMYKSWRWA